MASEGTLTRFAFRFQLSSGFMKKRPINKLVIIIIIALLVPILTYSVYQFVQIDENEALIQSIYDRQLYSILFSINQHCFDQISTWQSEMTSAATVDFANFLQLYYHPKIGAIVQEQPVIAGAFLRFSSEYFVAEYDINHQVKLPRRRFLVQKVNEIVENSSDKLSKAIQFARGGYIKPMAAELERAPGYTLLLFPILNDAFPEQGAIIGGLVIDNMAFIELIIALRFSALTEGEFVLAVKHKDSPEFIYYSTEDYPQGGFEQKQDNWILPDFELQIRMAGTTLQSLSRDRSRKNLILLIVVNIVFMTGLIYVVRNVSKEMELAKIKSNLVANVSHEIRTPVALIRMYAETLEMGRITKETKKNKYYKTILAETIRLTQLINNMLDFSKIESKKKEYRMRPTDLSLIVHQVIDMYHYNFEQRGFVINEDIDIDLPDVDADTEAITQAIVNLLDNAMKYSPDDKYIGIFLKQKEGFLILSISDHGIGIPESERKKIFQKFYRVGDSLVHNTKGSGLGLSLVEHIMRVHNGKVVLDSTVGQGSTFSLIFPIIRNRGE